MTRREFSHLSLSYLEEVTAYAHHLCRSEWDADDLVQATFERAFRKWQELSDPANGRAWLFRIARNLYLDRVRQATARSELRVVRPRDSLAPEPTVSAETVERLSARELEHALSRLPEHQREVLLLCDLWGFRYEEVAEITGTPVGTARSRISRARTELARSLLSPRKRSAEAGGQS